MARKIGLSILTAMLLLAIISAIWAWYRPEVKYIDRWHPAGPPRVIEKLQTVRIPVKEVVVIEKKAVSEKFKLPESIKQDAEKQVTAAAVIKYTDETATKVVSVLDTGTGQTELLQQQEPPSFFALENKREVYLQGGLSSSSGRQLELGGRWDFARVGNVHLGFYGHVNTEATGGAGVRLSYRF